jgi:glycosyltransferase involved in cell wall biosynthesis
MRKPAPKIADTERMVPRHASPAVDAPMWSRREGPARLRSDPAAPTPLRFETRQPAKILTAESMDAPPRVIIVCDNASLRMGGESARPLHYFRNMRSRGIEAWLCVHERCRDELRELLGSDFDRVYFAPDTWKHRLLWNMGKPFPHQFRIRTFGALCDLMTQCFQRKVVRGLISEKKIEIVHQPTPISPKQPSALEGFGVPVVIGPLNGDINYPPAFSHMENAFVRWSVSFSRMGGRFANWMIPGKLKAAAILVSNERTRRALPKGLRGKVIDLVANAVDLKTWEGLAGERLREPNAPPRFAFLGRLVDFKMIDLLLESFVPLAKEFNAHLDIIGEGEDRPQLEDLANTLGIAANVNFAGWMMYKDSASLIAKADAMVFPSLRECGGAVVMEAMASGLPVIAADWGGPADYVGTETDGAGILVKPDTRDGFVNGLTTAMRKLAASSDLRRRMSECARQRAIDHFQWDSRVDALLGVYAIVLNAGETTRRVDFANDYRRGDASGRHRIIGAHA